MVQAGRTTYAKAQATHTKLARPESTPHSSRVAPHCYKPRLDPGLGSLPYVTNGSPQEANWAGLTGGWCPQCLPLPVPSKPSVPACFCFSPGHPLPPTTMVHRTACSGEAQSMWSGPLLILLYLIKMAWCLPGVLHRAAGFMQQGAAG